MAEHKLQPEPCAQKYSLSAYCSTQLEEHTRHKDTKAHRHPCFRVVPQSGTSDHLASEADVALKLRPAFAEGYGLARKSQGRQSNGEYPGREISEVRFSVE